MLNKSQELKIPVGYLYRINNMINGKSYVGRRNLSLDKSWRQYMGSGKLIKQAISLYGVENFTKEFLGYYFDSKSLSEAEESLIKSEWASGHCEYNIGLTPEPDTVRKMTEERLIVRSRKISEATKERFGKTPDSNPFYQKSLQLKKEYELFKEQYEKVILTAFDAEPNATKIAVDNNFSKTWVIRILKENNRELQARNVEGYITSQETRRKQSEVNIINIIKANPKTYPATNTIKENIELYYRLKTKICSYRDCSKEFIFYRESQRYCSKECGNKASAHLRKLTNNLTYETLYELYIKQSLSIRKISEITGVGRSSIHRRLKEFEINKIMKNK